MAVVDDPALQQAIDLLKGEWEARKEGSFTTRAIDPAPLLTGQDVQADLIIFPSRLLGQLCEENRLRPVRTATLRSEQLVYADIYPVIRDRVLTYGSQTMALPIGCPTPLMMGLVEKETDTLPDAWERLSGAAAPQAILVGDGQLAAAYLFLARAVCYAASDTRESILLDPQSLEPRLTEPPFVKALEEMRAKGDTSRNLVWPLRPRREPPYQPHERSRLRITRLPGARAVFDPLNSEWVPGEAPPLRVTLLGSSGRLVGVTASSRNASAAFKLAAWLAGPRTAWQLATASPLLANVRVSLSRVSDDWTGAGDNSLGRQFSTALREAYQAPRFFQVPRILRADDYLAALGAQVAQAVEGQTEPKAALERAAKRWEELTDEVGRERQRKSYLRHLGVLPYEAPAR